LSFTVFTGHTWIINRKTPPHRDRGGFKAGFDYLSVLGTASSMISLCDINITANYNPGTVVGIPGRVSVYEVTAWGKGNRICVAQWIRERLLKKHGVPKIDCVTRGARVVMKGRIVGLVAVIC
jgi:hypothetical protein